MQTITITGFLSRDAELRSTSSGDPIANWNVPVRQGWGDKEQTNWFRVSIWGKRAGFAGKARKGDFVTVTGDLTIGEWEGKPQYEIRASDFQGIRPVPKGDAPRSGPDGSRGHAAQASSYDDDLDSDSVPFVRRDCIL
jgi:single-strand DNA-binding protein